MIANGMNSAINPTLTMIESIRYATTRSQNPAYCTLGCANTTGGAVGSAAGYTLPPEPDGSTAAALAPTGRPAPVTAEGCTACPHAGQKAAPPSIRFPHFEQ